MPQTARLPASRSARLLDILDEVDRCHVRGARRQTGDSTPLDVPQHLGVQVQVALQPDDAEDLRLDKAGTRALTLLRAMGRRSSELTWADPKSQCPIFVSGGA
jgi:hypothetical protein